jgi:hypothetical protein
MAYQTVLVHLDLDTHVAARVACAASLVAPGGVLVGAAMSGVSRLLYRGAPEPDSDQYVCAPDGSTRHAGNSIQAGRR